MREMVRTQKLLLRRKQDRFDWANKEQEHHEYCLLPVLSKEKQHKPLSSPRAYSSAKELYILEAAVSMQSVSISHKDTTIFISRSILPHP